MKFETFLKGILIGLNFGVAGSFTEMLPEGAIAWMAAGAAIFALGWLAILIAHQGLLNTVDAIGLSLRQWAIRSRRQRAECEAELAAKWAKSEEANVSA
jgi:hypothetical protein